jgi:sulfur-oxidizing protein SoxA
MPPQPVFSSAADTAVIARCRYVAHQSKGLPIDVAGDAAAARFIDAGRGIFEGRQGQLNLSCAQCHEAVLLANGAV